MRKAEYAASKGITIDQLQKEEMDFLQSEGFDDDGVEYQTLGEWLNRRPVKQIMDPFDGGRGAGQYGRAD